MLNSANLHYLKMLPYWVKLRELYAGEKIVKDKGVKYLPPSAGMMLDGMNVGEDGYKSYENYKQRAEYINYIRDAVETYVGLVNQEKPSIQLPKEMEYLRERATKRGESLESLLRKITTEQLKVGRCGLFVDLATSTQGSKPYLAFYDAESILNWNETDNYTGNTDLSMLVLREIVPVLTDFTWSEETRYRVCLIGDGSTPSNDNYKQGIFLSENFDKNEMFYPSYFNKKLNQIPFVFINACDILPDIDYPPLDDLANQSISQYCLSADYKQALHNQGQDTLLIKGHILNNESNEQVRIGAGSIINVGVDGDASFIGVNGDGIPEMRQALETCNARCESMAGRLITRSQSFESGESLKTRLNAETCDLNQIALTGAFGLERALKIIAEWIGANPDEIVIKPNLEFSDFSANGDDIVKLMTAKQQGCPLSYESIYDVMVARGYAKVPFKTQMEMIKNEEKDGVADVLTTMLTNALATSNSGLNPLNGNNAPKEISNIKKEQDNLKSNNGEE